MSNDKFPFKSFGQRLRRIREELHESVAEVSGAVEIDEKVLQSIERGEQLPSEDILMLLVNHLGIHGPEAKKLFELAEKNRVKNQFAFDEQFIKQMLMIIPVDNRILYSDSVNINVNHNGVVLNFLQQNGKSPIPIARIGISKEHAKNLVKTLNETLKLAEQNQKPKQLRDPSDK